MQTFILITIVVIATIHLMMASCRCIPDIKYNISPWRGLWVYSVLCAV